MGDMKTSALDKLLDEADGCWCCYCDAEDQTCMCSESRNHDVTAARAELSSMRDEIARLKADHARIQASVGPKPGETSH